MLKHQLLHPTINEVLGRAGHSSRVLISDSNYPCMTTLGPRAVLVSLNLMPGVVDSVQALQAVASAVPIESAHVMQYATEGPYAMDSEPPVWNSYRSVLNSTGAAVDIEPIERFAFYEAVAAPDVALVIHTADQALFANILLTIGVRQKGE